MKSKCFLWGCMALTLILTNCKDDDEKPELKSLKVTPTSVSLVAGTTQPLTVTTDPAGLNVVLEWQSENPTIATVSGEGVVTAQKEGNTTVKVKSGKIEASVPVSVTAAPVPLENITVDEEVVSLKVDDTKEIIVTLVPANATNITVTFESDKNAVATVSAAGVITAVGVGTAVISVKGGSITKTIAVTVTIKDFAVTPESIILELPGSQQLAVTTVPEGAAGVVFAYESSDPNIATVSATGLVEAVAAGRVSVTVSSGDISKQVTVTVSDPNLPQQYMWQILGFSSEWNDGTPAAAVIDGNPVTLWHSDPGAGLPQWISVDMGAPKNIDGFLFTNRQQREGGVDGSHPKHIVLEISNDGTTWETALEETRLPDLYQQQILPLEERKTARYFKITINTTWSGELYTYMSEIGIYAGSAPEPNPGPEVEPPVPEGWGARASSQIMGADRMVDGNINTEWHSAPSAGLPWAIIDFREDKTIYGIEFTNRQGGPTDTNSLPKHVVFSVSDDDDENSDDWTTLLEVEELSEVQTTQILEADAPQTGRYLKIDIKSTWAMDESDYSYIAEIDIITEPVQGND